MRTTTAGCGDWTWLWHPNEVGTTLWRARPVSHSAVAPARIGGAPQATLELRTKPVREYGAIALAFLLGLALRAWGLQGQSLTMDEVAELDIAAGSLEGIVWVRDGFPPLYHILLHGWRDWFPSPESARWLSVLLGCLSVLAIWRLARRVGGIRVGLCTALLLAVSPFHIWYSQEARAYGLYFLLAIVALWSFARASETNRYTDWALYGLVSLVGVYTHYYFAMLLLINGALVLVEKRHWRDLKPAMLAHAGLALLSAPAIWLLEHDLSHQASFHIDLYAPFNIASVGYTYFTFIAGFSVGPSIRELHAISAAEAVVQALPWALLVGFAGIVLAYHGFKVLGGRTAARLAIIAVAPALVSGLLAISLGIGFRVRYVVWAAIPVLIILGAGLSRPGFRWSVAAAALALAVVSAVSLLNRHTVDRYRNEDTRGVSAYLKSVSSPATPIFIISDYMVKPTRHYMGDSWFLCAVPSVAGPDGDPGEALRVIETNAPAASPFWLVYTRPFHGDPRSEVRDTLLKLGIIRQRAKFAGIDLYEGLARWSGPTTAPPRAGADRATTGCVDFSTRRATTE